MRLPIHDKRLVLVLCLLAGISGVALAYHAIQEHDEDSHRFHKVVPGVLYRSRQPRPEDLKGLPRRGVTTVVNLRRPEEDPQTFEQERQACRELGLTLVSLPQGRTLSRDEQVEEFLKLVRAGRGGVLVHCEYGRARTGLMVAAYRVVVEGWRPRRAMAEIYQFNDEVSGEEGPAWTELLKRLYEHRQEWLDRTAPAGE